MPVTKAQLRTALTSLRRQETVVRKIDERLSRGNVRQQIDARVSDRYLEELNKRNELARVFAALERQYLKENKLGFGVFEPKDP